MILAEKCSVATGRDKDIFIGLKYDQGDIKISFPYGYDIPHDEKELKKSILSLFKTISITKTIERNLEDLNDKFENNYQLPIYSYYIVLNDFLKFGLYHNIEKIHVKNNGGKINWNKTIQKSIPLISNRNLIYTDTYYERTRNIDNVITEIQKYCLTIANAFFGWFFGNPTIPKSKFNDKYIDYMLLILNRELNVSFSDRKKNLLLNLISILTGMDSNFFKSKLFTFGTNKYHVVWEKMINDLYGNVPISEYYPSAKWILIDGNKERASDLRPDSIHVDNINKKVYVLDAKYYHYCITEKIAQLPGSDSIQKQITYASYINENKHIDGDYIFNAFMLPYNMRKNGLNVSKPIVYLGYSECDWILNKNNKLYSYHKVSLILIDTKYLIDSWYKKNIMDFEELANEIEKIKTHCTS